MKRIFSLFLAMLIFASTLSIPASAATSAGTCPYCGSPLIRSSVSYLVGEQDHTLCTNKDCKYNTTAGRLLFYTYNKSSGGTASPVSNTATVPKPYYTSSKPSGSSGGSGNVSNILNQINSGNTNYYSTINTTNKTLNYTTYNTTTNNYIYNTYNYTNYTYNYDYNYYTVNVDNSTHYVIDNVNYITVVYPTGDTVTNIDGSVSNSYNTVDIYYQLPSGKNSYDVSPADVWGEYFIYNVDSCEKVLEDDGTTLGLWHLDGDFSDSSANAGKYRLSSNITTFVDVGVGSFGQALSGTSSYISIRDFGFFSTPWTIEFRIYVTGESGSIFLFALANTKYYESSVFPSSTSVPKTPLVGDPELKTSLAAWGMPMILMNANQWNSVALTFDGNALSTFVNGISGSSYSSVDEPVGICTYATCIHGFSSWQSSACVVGDPYKSVSYEVGSNGTHQCTIASVSKYQWAEYSFPSNIQIPASVIGAKRTYDEIRHSRGILYDSDYSYSLQPYDTNSVLVLPQNPAENDIAIMSNVPVTSYRIGGVRPTFPKKGDVYIYHEDDVVKNVQQYQDGGWVSVDARIYTGNTWQNLTNYNLGSVKPDELETVPDPDVDPDPDKPNPAPGGCDHEYAVTKEKAPTCTASGYTIYKCSICGDTYTDTFKALGHDWQLIESTPSNSGEESPGYTLYRCSRCGEEYKDFEGSGPPSDDEDKTFWDWLKELFSTIWNGLLDLLESILSGTIGLLVRLVDDLFSGIVHIVDVLFEAFLKIADFGGAFKDFLAAFFSYIPEEIIVLLAFSISLSIILMIIKFFKG